MTWTPTKTYGTWGHLRVLVGGRDVTWFRDAPTQVQGWEHTDPYGPSSASLVFPQITVWDDRADNPALAWLYEGATVKINRVLGGQVVDPRDPPFYGIIDAIEETDDGLNVSCAGNFNGRMSSAMHQPPQVRRYNVDGGLLMFRQLNYGTNHIEIYPHGGLVTGINVEAEGSRDMTRLGRADQILGLLVKENGDSVTLLPDPSRPLGSYRLQWRELKSTPDATVYLGAQGVKVSLRRDLLDMVSAVYGEGVAPGGERWRNRVSPNLDDATPVPPYPFGDGRSFGIGTTDAETSTGDGVLVMVRELFSDGLLTADDAFTHNFDADVEDAVQEMQRNLHVPATGRMTPSLWNTLFTKTGDTKSKRGAYFAPLAIDNRTDYWIRASDGTPIRRNPDFDQRVPVVEEFESYGEGVRKKHARRNARGKIAHGAARIGTVTLETDPAEMSKLNLRPGMTLRLAGFNGSGINLYISQFSVDNTTDKRPVTLTVSDTPRHWLDLQTILQRNRDARKDPARKAAHQRRRSAAVSDSLHGWEGESGSGIMPRRDLQGGQWNVFSFQAAERGVMREVRYNVNPNIQFYFAVFADKVRAGVLNRRLGDPSQWVGEGKNRLSVWQAHDDFLTDDERKLVEGWGNPDNPCGYSGKPHTVDGEVTDHPLTGILHDRASWQFASDSGRLWVAVWPTQDCTGFGRAKIQIHEGV